VSHAGLGDAVPSPAQRWDAQMVVMVMKPGDPNVASMLTDLRHGPARNPSQHKDTHP
jgi:hypothetical protein